MEGDGPENTNTTWLIDNDFKEYDHIGIHTDDFYSSACRDHKP